MYCEVKQKLSLSAKAKTLEARLIKYWLNEFMPNISAFKNHIKRICCKYTLFEWCVSVGQPITLFLVTVSLVI